MARRRGGSWFDAGGKTLCMYGVLVRRYALCLYTTYMQHFFAARLSFPVPWHSFIPHFPFMCCTCMCDSSPIPVPSVSWEGWGMSMPVFLLCLPLPPCALCLCFAPTHVLRLLSCANMLSIMVCCPFSLYVSLLFLPSACLWGWEYMPATMYVCGCIWEAWNLPLFLLPSPAFC